MRFAGNLVLLLLSLAGLLAVGELTVRHLQSLGHLPDYRHPMPVSAQQKQINANFIPLRKVADERLYVELDPAHPQVNRYGFRGPEPALHRPAGRFRIAVLGDSVAFGYGLTREEAFPHQLEAHLQRQGLDVEVLNFAVSGYGIEAYTALYETKVRPFAPDLVVLAYVLNDPMPTAVMFQAIGSLMRQEAGLRRLAQTSQFAAWAWRTWQQASGPALSRLQNSIIYRTETTRHLLSAHFQQLRALTAADKTTLAVFIFPYFTDFENYNMQQAHTLVRTELHTAGIHYHDLLSGYATLDARSLRLTPDDITHPNADGQRLAAIAIGNTLEYWRMLPATPRPSLTP